MKRYQLSALIGLACLGFGVNVAMADTGALSLNGFRHKVLPVLVQVNAHGKITGVSPSMKLRPRFVRLLRQNLDEMIAKPATEHGHPIASQFVITLGLNAKPRKDGRYDASFFYVSSKPVPSGSWLWVHENGHRLALVNRDALRDANQWLHGDYERRRRRDNYYRQFPGGLQHPRIPSYKQAATSASMTRTASSQSTRSTSSSGRR